MNSSIRSALSGSGSVEASPFPETFHDSGCPIVATKGMVRRVSGSVVEELFEFPRMWNLLVQPHVRKPQKPRVSSTLHVEVIK